MVESSGKEHFLRRSITRREAIRAGGIAALGLAFSKPLIETVYPKPAFANYQVANPPSHCTLKIALLSIAYSGKDIGNDWSFKVAINVGGVSKDIAVSNYSLSNGDTRQIGRVIFDDKVGGCGVDIPVDVKIAAKENDYNNPDDYAYKAFSRTLNCPARGRSSVTIPVYEKYGYNSYSSQPALLEFTFGYSAQCS